MQPDIVVDAGSNPVALKMRDRARNVRVMLPNNNLSVQEIDP